MDLTPALAERKAPLTARFALALTTRLVEGNRARNSAPTLGIPKSCFDGVEVRERDILIPSDNTLCARRAGLMDTLALGPISLGERRKVAYDAKC